MPRLTVARLSLSGGTAAQRERIRSVLGLYPDWVVRAARLSAVVLTSRADVATQQAMYEHNSRLLWIWDGIDSALLGKALIHELAHGWDDNFGHPHYFSSQKEWQVIHRHQPEFDIPKYRDQPLEYFADMVAKFFLLGPTRLSTTHPKEVTFIHTWVIPTLKKEFSNE